MELDPGSAERLHVLAQYYIDDNQYKKAIAILAKIIAMPQDKNGEIPEYEFFESMKSLYTDDNDYDNAQKIYTKLLKQAGNDEERALVYMMISYMYEDAKDEENAIANAERAADLCPANYPALKRLGDCYSHFKQNENALKAYNMLLALAKNDTSENKNLRLRYYYENVAPLHLEMNKPDKAIACYKKMLPLYDSPKDSYYALEQLAAIHYQQKQYDKAVPYLKKIIKLWPTFYPRAYTSMELITCMWRKMPRMPLITCSWLLKQIVLTILI